MRAVFRCVSFSENPAPPGQQPTYNFVLQIVPDDPANVEQFGGIPSGTISVSGAKQLPFGYGVTRTIDLNGVDGTAAPQQGPQTFGRAQRPPGG